MSALVFALLYGCSGASDSQPTNTKDSTPQDSAPCDASLWYADADGDGYGDALVTEVACDAPTDYVEDYTDCDDSDSAVHPGQAEICDDAEQDEDCDGLVNEADDSLDTSTTSTFYGDADGDGYGDPAQVQAACAIPDGTVTNADDCDDSSAEIRPDAVEDCSDEVDNNCDGLIEDCPLSGGSLSTAIRFTGEAASDAAGWAVAMAGDVDADGYDDILVGVSEESSTNDQAGAAYLIRGGSLASGSLADADVKITGNALWQYFGTSVAGVGDVNADGWDDLLIGTPNYYNDGSDRGGAFLVLGSSSLSSGSINRVVDAIFTGDNDYDQAGCSVASAGDVNQDGYADMLVGSRYNDDAGASAGAAYLLWGGTALSSMSLSEAGLQWTGASNGDLAGAQVAGAGDVDSDGYPDLLVASPWQGTGPDMSGTVYLIRGGEALTSGSLTDADASFVGEGPYTQVGGSLAGAGDVNGDGYQDIIIGSYYDNEQAAYAGAAWLFYGGVGLTSSRMVEDADLKWLGEAANDVSGQVGNVGDINQDGFDDIVIGSSHNDNDGGMDAGKVYLIWGQSSLAGGVLTDADLFFTGEGPTNYAGNFVAGGGDTNADGHPDLLIGATGSDAGATDAGAIYLVLGQ